MAKLLTRREAAERIGVHVRTLRSWEQAGELRAHKRRIGRRELVYYDEAELTEVAGRHYLIHARIPSRVPDILAEHGGALRAPDELASLRAENAALRAEVERLHALLATLIRGKEEET